MNSPKLPFALDPVEKRVRDYLDRGRLADGISLVHQRAGGRGGILRVSIGGNRTVIVKTWKLSRHRDRVKRLVWMSNTRREWRVHRYLHACGVRVPEAFAYRAGHGAQGPYECILVEDLGPVTNALAYLKACLRRGDEAEIRRLEDEVIENTARMVHSRVMDIDNKLNNFGITASGELYRLDLECARRWRVRRPPTAVYGKMLGYLVGSHAFACQPDLARTEAFAGRLAEALKPPQAVLSAGRLALEAVLLRQKDRSGIDSRLSLPW